MKYNYELDTYLLTYLQKYWMCLIFLPLIKHWKQIFNKKQYQTINNCNELKYFKQDFESVIRDCNALLVKYDSHFLCINIALSTYLLHHREAERFRILLILRSWYSAIYCPFRTRSLHSPFLVNGYHPNMRISMWHEALFLLDIIDCRIIWKDRKTFQIISK